MHSFKSAARQQESLAAGLEKRILVGIAKRLPRWINSDHLTLAGFLGMCMAGLFYFLAKSNSLALVAAIVCLGVNWFGDSLDGTLARVRDRQRPRYGFYVDHILDSFGAVFLIGGIGLSGYMTGSIAMALLITYFLLSIELYLAAYCVGIFRLSFSIWGPTELRIVLAAGTLLLYWKPVVVIFGKNYMLCDAAGVVAIVGMLLMTVVNTIRNTMRLYEEEHIP